MITQSIATDSSAGVAEDIATPVYSLIDSPPPPNDD